MCVCNVQIYVVIGLNEQEGKRERDRKRAAFIAKPETGSDWLKCSIEEVNRVLQVTLKDAEEVIKVACSASAPGIS